MKFVKGENMKKRLRSIFSILIIGFLIFQLTVVGNISITPDHKAGEEAKTLKAETDNNPIEDQRANGTNHGYLQVDKGTQKTLGFTDSGDYTGIWVQEDASLILQGCKLNLSQGEDGHQGEFNISDRGTIHILMGSEIYIEKGNFSARCKEFRMEDSTITVVNVTGGEAGQPGSTGAKLDGRPGNDSVVEIITTQPVNIKNSEIYCYGKTGGTGAAGIDDKKMNGGHGGKGGEAEIYIESAKVDITDDCILKASGGDGGEGGERAPTISNAKGGDGGVGGKGIVTIESKGSITLRNSDFIAMAGGGGDASRTSGDELYGKGGWGGESNIRISAYTSVTFDHCFIYSLGGDLGLGGDRNMDGYFGGDKLRLKALYNSIEGSDSTIRTSADSFGIDCPANTNILDNVSISDREGPVRPYSIIESVIEVYWDILVKVVDDHTKAGIQGAEVEIRAKDDSDVWEMLSSADTNQYGYAFFEGILSRTIKGNNLGKDLTVRIHAMKHTYKAEKQVPLTQSLNLVEDPHIGVPDNKAAMILKILTLGISSISYRSVLVGDDEQVHVNKNDVINGNQALGGIIYINGTAQIFSSTQEITKIVVSVDGAGEIEVDDISSGSERSWSSWSYRFETASKSKSGTGDKTKINYFYDNEEILLRFAAFEGHGFTTETNITPMIKQGSVNNPPYGMIMKIDGEEVDSDDGITITLPPIKEKRIVLEGSFFDIDEDSITPGNVWVRLVPSEAGKTVTEPLISDSKNTIIDRDNRTWTVNWDLRYSLFQVGDYIMSVDIGDSRGTLSLNTSDSDHFEIHTIPITIYLESNPKAVISKIDGIDLGDFWDEGEGKYIIEKEDENNIMEIFFDASGSNVPDAGVVITNYYWIVTDMADKKELDNVDAGLKKTYSFADFKVDDGDDYHEYKVELKVKDDRGYTSGTTVDNEIIIKIIYVPPPPEEKGWFFDYNLPFEIFSQGDILFIALILIFGVMIFLMIKKNTKVKNKIAKRSEVAKRKTVIQEKKKIKSLAEIEGQSKDNVMYVAGGVGKQDYSPGGQGYYSSVAQGYGAPQATPGPSYSQPAQPIKAPPTHPTAAPVTQPPSTQVTTSQPVSRPFTSPVTTSPPTTAPVTQPVIKPLTSPVTQPVTRPVSPTTQPVIRPVTAPTTQPVTRPVTAPTTQPVTRPVTSPTTQSVPQQAGTPGKKCPGCGSETKPGWFICPNCKTML